MMIHFFKNGTYAISALLIALVLGCGKASESNTTDSTNATDEFTLIGEVVD